MSIERLQIEEVFEAKAVLRQVWIDTYTNYTSEEIDKITAVWHDPQSLMKEVKNPKYYFAVAKYDKKIVGVITAHIAKKSIKIPRIYILKSYQGQGIGSQFLDKAVNAFPDAEIVELGVEEENKKALGFYENHGFIVTGNYEEEVGGHMVKLVIMQKKIIIVSQGNALSLNKAFPWSLNRVYTSSLHIA